jgi:hypothetical protein
VVAVTRSKRAKEGRRQSLGASVSKRLLRWPSRNYFSELESSAKESHPVDDLMGRDRALRRLRSRAGRFLARAQTEAISDALLDFEAERNHLDAARVEVAYNIGFESGLVLGRAEGLRRTSGNPRDVGEEALLGELRGAIAGSGSSSDKVQALLLELAWGLAFPPPPGRAKKQ